jgi:recombinational DNA repair protein (RecF pathway)
MPPIKTDAFVLKRIDFRETSVILTLFTKELGKIKGVLKGVRETERNRYSYGSRKKITLC